VGLMFLALYAALQRAHKSSMAIAVALAGVGIAVYFASNTALSMLALSDQYAAATTDVQRSMFLAAGEMVLVTFNGTASQVSYVFAAIALITISVVMLRSGIFSKITGYVGIITNVLALGFYLPEIGIIFGLISVLPFLIIWNILIARRFFQLGQGKPDKTVHKE